MPAIPVPDRAASHQAAQAWMRDGHILGALEALHRALGDVFQLPLPGFQSAVLVGPEADRLILTESREHFLWRAEGDPVTRLLRQGLLVTDGAFHDELRQVMAPALHRSLFDGFIEAMWRNADRVTCQWRDGARIDLLVEMRRIALLILTDTLFKDDFSPHISTLWPDLLRTIRYISPGPWLVLPHLPRMGYRQPLRRMDGYFYRLIALRRAQPGIATDLLGRLIAFGMSDGLIRDQLLTMFIAGHDTSTALLAWALHLLTVHPDILARVRAEIDTVVGMEIPTNAHVRRLSYLDAVIKETLRLYPPIHLGSRIAAADVVFRDFHFPAGRRVLYSIYLTHHDPKYWPAPDRFDPDRFLSAQARDRVAYSFLPFGGGPRNCIGAAFAQVEAKVVLARILQRYEFRAVGGGVRPRMRATLEPHPGVLVEVRRRPRLNMMPAT
ncbi:MAG TPA: cytochrome P450 [Ktedonobacterales bacterium]|nr:cytochrome P450 [Ktedonobacterales bacterium]